MSTNNNQDKKSTDTKPKGEVKNINTTTKGLFDYHKEKKDIKIRQMIVHLPLIREYPKVCVNLQTDVR